MLIVDGTGADSCNDLICLCAWRWKDRTPPERIAPSFSVNRVNYLYNEICKVVNFSSSLFLPSQLFTPPRTFPGSSAHSALSRPFRSAASHLPLENARVSAPLVTSINIISSGRVSLHILSLVRYLFIYLTSGLLIRLSPPLSPSPATLPPRLHFLSRCCFGLISLFAEAY